jgi:hypothetical protein
VEAPPRWIFVKTLKGKTLLTIENSKPRYRIWTEFLLICKTLIFAGKQLEDALCPTATFKRSPPFIWC